MKPKDRTTQRRLPGGWRSSAEGARATGVLVAGLLAAAGLVWAALGLLGAPQLDSEAALARLAGKVADGVVEEWDRFLRGDVGGYPHDKMISLAAGAGLPFLWTLGREDVLPIAVPRDVRARRDGDATSFEALLSEARRLEVVEHRYGDALDVVLHALERPPDENARAEGRLRAVQMGVKAQRADTAAAQWQAASEELQGDEALDGVSVLLLCGLAAAPALDAPGRERAFDLLAQRWVVGQLALPDPVDDFVADAADPAFGTTSEPPRRNRLWQRLAHLATTPLADDPRWSLDSTRRSLAALFRAIGPVPADQDTTFRWHVQRGPMPFWWKRDPEGRVIGCFCPFTTVGSMLRSQLAGRELLPEGFSVDFAGDDERAGPVVRARTPLLGDEFGFVLRHRDPQAFLSAERRRAGWLRTGLLLTAAFTAVAALSSARALRRERALAELKSAFVASVSHELRTPVSSILLMAENMESGRVADEASRGRYHGLIRREAQRLRRLVDDVLDVSRLERGEGPRVRPEDIGLRAFLDDVAGEARELVERAGGTWHHEREVGGGAGAAAELPESASLDADAVRRAVLNLVDNALRHSGSRDVTFSARAEGGDLLLVVADRGHGIGRRERERIFEPFERLATDGRGTPGTGLGLSIVRGIARGHGGDAAVLERVPGPGSSFVLRLPVLAAEDVTGPEEAA